MKPIKLFIVDSAFDAPEPGHWQPALRAIRDCGGIAVYGSASSAREVIEGNVIKDVDVVVLDMDAYVDESADLMQALTERAGRDVPVIGLCRAVDEARLAFSVGLGVAACVDRNQPRDIVQAIVEVARGGVPIQRAIAAQPALLWNLASALRERFRAPFRPQESRPAASIAPSSGSDAGECPISEREASILEMVADGFSYREISETLTIAERTVKNHMARSLEKLGARGRAHAVRMALQAGWICNGDRANGSNMQVVA